MGFLNKDRGREQNKVKKEQAVVRLRKAQQRVGQSLDMISKGFESNASIILHLHLVQRKIFERVIG